MPAEDDPRPTLDLLWTGIDPPRRGPRHRLTVDAVVEAATALAEEAGLAALSMRHVASALDVGAATLYTYVPGKSALLALMVDTMISRTPLPHLRPGTWRDQVADSAREELREYRAHPWLVDLVAVERPYGPGMLAWLDSALRTFEGTGLSDRETLTAIGAVEGYVRGHAAVSVESDRAASRITPDGEGWSEAQWSSLEERMSGGRFPAIARISDPGPDADEVFEQGLDWLLDGIEHRIRVIGRS